MNRFILDSSPVLSARALCDKHVVKMCLEEAQILCSALLLNGVEHPELYKLAHRGHPVVKWTALGYDHFMFGYNYFIAISAEYELRYGRQHLSYTRLHSVLWELGRRMPHTKVESWPVCANGTSYVSYDEAINLYREYYARDKASIAVWNSGRSEPDWWLDYCIKVNMRG